MTTSLRLSPVVPGFSVRDAKGAHVFGCARRLSLVILVLAWVLAVGWHDFLMQDHHHDQSSPELALVQSWHSETKLSPTLPPAPEVALLLPELSLVLTPPLLDVPVSPETWHEPPRPPTGLRPLFRGPPVRTASIKQSEEWEKPRVENIVGVVGAGIVPVCRRATPG